MLKVLRDEDALNFFEFTRNGSCVQMKLNKNELFKFGDVVL